MNYHEAIKLINSLPQCGFKRFGISGILKFLEVLGNPQKKLKYIHIAGTNGKGSVAMFCASSLTSAGFKTGLYISPYVINFRERIQIDGRFIKKKELVCLVNRTFKLIKKLNEKDIYLTTFDYITAISIYFFYEKKCDFVVLEVGLGGRLDSTNVISSAAATIITHIDYDHVKDLGGEDGSILNIAYEKAGILKRGSVLVCSNNQYVEVLDFLKNKAKEKGVEFVVSYSASFSFCSLKKTCFSFDGVFFKTKLLGRHQVENAMLAITALLQIGINLKYVKKGLKKAFMPARFEIVKKKPLFILDGAHNENGVDCLKENLEFFLKCKKIAIISIITTKDYSKMLSKIKGVFEVVILTKMAYEKAIETKILKEECSKLGINFVVEDDVFKAIKMAEGFVEEKGVVVAFGSLYFVGQVRKHLKKYD